MLIVDAHEDLAWNMLTFGRDYSLPVKVTRQRESGTEIASQNGDTLLGWQDYQLGKVAVVFSSLFAAPFRRQLGDWDKQCYGTPEQAHALYLAQLDAYYRLCENREDKFRLILTLSDLEKLLEIWKQEATTEHPVGLVLAMEGAEGVLSTSDLEGWWRRGVRWLGPAWASNRYCGGTREPGPLTSQGFTLLESMSAFGFGLDLSHMDEKAALQALDVYPGMVIASHSNAAALLYNSGTVEVSNRFLSNRLLHGIIEREGVVGIVPYNRFLILNWTISMGKQAVTLAQVVAQIDYICQMAGDARHVGIGSDFDGGIGWQSVPAEIDTVADIQKLIPLLQEKGYTGNDIASILGENWLGALRRILPE